MTIFYDKRDVGVSCDSEKLKEVITSLIESRMSDVFSFKQLIDVLSNQLDSEGLLDKESNTRYDGGVTLNVLEIEKVNKMVWDMIWDRKLMLDLYNHEYRHTPDRTSTRLIKVK